MAIRCATWCVAAALACGIAAYYSIVDLNTDSQVPGDPNPRHLCFPVRVEAGRDCDPDMDCCPVPRLKGPDERAALISFARTLDPPTFSVRPAPIALRIGSDRGRTSCPNQDAEGLSPAGGSMAGTTSKNRLGPVPWITGQATQRGPGMSITDKPGPLRFPYPAQGWATTGAGDASGHVTSQCPRTARISRR